MPPSQVVPNTTRRFDPSRLCAYNESRECFLSLDVELVTSPSISTNECLGATPSESGAALWIVFPRDLPSPDVQVLLDLLYLDRNCVVTAVVECFPLSKMPQSEGEPASILALPAMTVSRTMTRVGHQLMLRTMEQLKLRLGELPDSEAHTKPEEASSSIGAALAKAAQLSREAGDRVPKPDARPLPASSKQKPPAEILSISADPSQEESDPSLSPSTRVRKLASAAMNFWQQWWYVDPRGASREELPQIIAYFFTGGAPVPHVVQNISPGGLYVVAEERWYLGTIIRITLADESDPASERSITVNAMVVRYGKDGVGLQFVFPEKAKPGATQASDPGLVNVNPAQLHQFLQRFRDGTSSDRALRTQN